MPIVTRPASGQPSRSGAPPTIRGRSPPRRNAGPLIARPAAQARQSAMPCAAQCFNTARRARSAPIRQTVAAVARRPANRSTSRYARATRRASRVARAPGKANRYRLCFRLCHETGADWGVLTACFMPDPRRFPPVPTSHAQGYRTVVRCELVDLRLFHWGFGPVPPAPPRTRPHPQHPPSALFLTPPSRGFFSGRRYFLSEWGVCPMRGCGWHVDKWVFHVEQCVGCVRTSPTGAVRHQSREVPASAWVYLSRCWIPEALSLVSVSGTVWGARRAPLACVAVRGVLLGLVWRVTGPLQVRERDVDRRANPPKRNRPLLSCPQ